MTTYAPGRTPYLYAICWTRLNMAYVGVRYGKGCHPNDFWRTYFTSSNYVAAFRAEHGEPDHIQIIDTFLTPAEAISAEIEIIRDFALHTDPRFLNMNVSRQPEWTDKLRAVIARKGIEAADRKSPQVTLNGKQVCLREISRLHGIPIGVLNKRYRNGLMEADLIQPIGQERKLYLYKGVKCSIPDLARIAGVNRQTITNRLKRMSVDDAMLA